MEEEEEGGRRIRRRRLRRRAVSRFRGEGGGEREGGVRPPGTRVRVAGTWITNAAAGRVLP